MSDTVRSATPRGPRSRARLSFAALGILAIVLVITWRSIEPRPPHRLRILSGPPGTVYHDYGRRYAAYLRGQGLLPEHVTTAGSLDNLRLLASGGPAAVGFAQTGVENELESGDDPTHVVSLGSVAFEPFWAFVLDEHEISSIRDLKGRRVGLGPAGSGSRATAVLLLADNELEDAVQKVTLEEPTPDAVAQALTSKEVDAVFLVGEIGSPVIAHLLEHPDVVPLSLPRTAAYTRRHRSIAELTLPKGAFSLARDIPARDLELVSPTTNLVTRDDLPPPVIGLLLQGAKEIHHPASLFAPEGTFPNARHTSLPLSPAAIRYLDEGQGLIYRLLPFWLAGLLSWLTKLLTPFVTVAHFLFKAVPGLVQLRFSMRLKRLYRRLERLEKSGVGHMKAEDLQREFDALDGESVGLRVPRALVAPYLEFRQFLHDMRERQSR